MIISVITPHQTNAGNTIASLLLAHALADTKRKTFLTHVSAQSSSFEAYLGLESYVDKTSTPTQLVKLMREGAIKPEDIGDYCKNDVDFLDIFTNNKENFSTADMNTLVDFITDSPDTGYEYLVFDIDADLSYPTAQTILKKSDLILINTTSSTNVLKKFEKFSQSLLKIVTGKKTMLLVSSYDAKAIKLKDVSKHLGMKTAPFTIRYNVWIQWACNEGRLSYFFSQGKAKDMDAHQTYKDALTLATAVSKAKVVINRQKQSKQ